MPTQLATLSDSVTQMQVATMNDSITQTQQVVHSQQQQVKTMLAKMPPPSAILAALQDKLCGEFVSTC